MSELSPEEAFARDIPDEHQESVLVMLSESAQSCGEHECVSVIERDRIDAINVRASLILTFEGREYSVFLEDGNWNGTVIRGWENHGKDYEPHQPTRWALAPRPGLISDASATGQSAFLIAKWDALLKNPAVSEIPGKYGYDRFGQPGSLIENYWRGEAEKLGFVIVSQEEADEVRARLSTSTEGGQS